MFVLVSSISIPSSYTDLLAAFLIWIHKISSLLSFSISLRLVLPGVHYMLIKETGGRENRALVFPLSIDEPGHS